jgi:toxin ParE1/3/4
MNWIIQYSAQAKSDLWTIRDYIAISLKEPQIADKLIHRILDAVDLLAYSPFRRRFDKEPWQSLGMRRLNVGNYAVFFIPEEETGIVKIIRIAYGRMDLERVLEETGELEEEK